MALSSGLSETLVQGLVLFLPHFLAHKCFHSSAESAANSWEKSTYLTFFFCQTLGYNKRERHPPENYCFSGNSLHEAKKKTTMRQRRDETHAVLQITCFSAEYLVSRVH